MTNETAADTEAELAREAELKPETGPAAEAGMKTEAGPEAEAGTKAGGGEVQDERAGLEEEGEIAADYLEELLDIADLDGDIDIDVDHGRAAVAIVTEDSEESLGSLVGKKGEVLDALQELTRLAVQAKTGDRSRLMLDVAGYRNNRRQELTALAEEAIAQVRGNGADVALQPMNPFERKVVHDAVADAGLVSDSEGAEPNRHVVIRSAS